jgi:choice-of-anchor C domain-containing protein
VHRRRWLPIALAVLMFTTVLTAFLPGQAVAQPTSIVVNGDFEQPVVFGDYATVGPPGFDGWTVDAGTVDIVHELWTAASGLQSLDLNGFCCIPAGSISQALPTTPGATYILSFSLAGNPDPVPICLGSPQVKEMEVFWGEASLGVFEFDVTGHTLADPGWQQISMPVAAGPSTTTLRFTSLLDGFACGPALDDVAVTQSPTLPERPGKGCGDKNHVHQREGDCKKTP